MADEKLCSIPGCSKPVRSRGWCITHYMRWRNNGHPEKLRGLLGRGKLEISGQRFGKLVAVSVSDMGGKQGVRWLCECDCGNETVVLAKKLRGGHTKSCGCVQKASRITHGQTGSLEYASWQAMRYRCEYQGNVMFHRYGGRGIKVCDRWLSFENFLADMGEKPTPAHTIDRIDNDRDYEPENCRWATKLEQDNNRSTNRVIHVGNSVGSIASVYRSIDPRPVVSLKAAWMRIWKGWEPTDAFYVPIKCKRAYEISRAIALRPTSKS